MRGLWVLLVWCVASGAAAQGPTVERVLVVGRAEPGGTWTDAATEARTGDGAELAVVAVAREGRRRVVIADAGVTPLRVEGRRVFDEERRSFDVLGGVEVRWSLVEPLRPRVSLTPVVSFTTPQATPGARAVASPLRAAFTPRP